MLKQRLWRFLVLHRYLLPYLDKQVLVYLCSVGFLSFSVITPYLSRLVVDYGIMRGDMEVFKAILVFGIVLFVFSSVIGVLQSYLSFYIGIRLGFQLRSDYYNTVLNKTLTFFENRTTGEILYRISADTSGVVGLVTGTIPGILLALMRFAFITAICLWLSWKATLFVMAVAPLAYVMNHYVGKWSYRVNRELNIKGQAISDDIQDHLSRVRLIKAFFQERKALASYRRVSIAQIRVLVINFWLGVVSGQASQYLSHAFALVVTFALGSMVIRGSLSLGSYIALTIYLFQLFGLVRSFGGMYQGLISQFVFVDRYFEVVGDEFERARFTGPVKKLEPCPGPVVLNGVSFGYGDHPVIREANLTVRPAETLAILGASGAGKTTLASVMAGMGLPEEGAVYLTGKDIRALGSVALRKTVSIALQEPLLLNRSLKENLLFARGSATEADMRKAVEAAGLAPVIQSHPLGWDLPVGPHGVRLSLGQIQRVGLAMALVKESPVLIMDEATNQVEPEVEAEILTRIRQTYPDMAVVMLSVRQSIVGHADRVLVLKDGRLEEAAK